MFSDEQETNQLENNPVDDVIVLIPVGRNRSHVINDLTPSTKYRVRVRTCYATDNVTIGDTNVTERCNVGSSAEANTLSAPPNDQPRPELRAMGPRTVEATWNPPLAPNGVIMGYTLYRRLAEPSDPDVAFEKRVFVGGNPRQRSYTDVDPELRPFTKYKYKASVWLECKHICANGQYSCKKKLGHISSIYIEHRSL